MTAPWDSQTTHATLGRIWEEWQSHMPRKTISYTGAPLDPAEYTALTLPSGDLLQFPIFFDLATQRELVQCDICARFCPLTSKRSIAALQKHRGKNECSKAAQRKERNHMQNQVSAEAQAALHALFNTSQAAPRTVDIPSHTSSSGGKDHNKIWLSKLKDCEIGPAGTPMKLNIAETLPHSVSPDEGRVVSNANCESDPSSSRLQRKWAPPVSNFASSTRTPVHQASFSKTRLNISDLLSPNVEPRGDGHPGI